MAEHTFSFKANSHILSLLGDELIGSDNLAIFELVKNAYDADATRVQISFENVNEKNARIIVEDNGTGMSLSVIENAWLEIGTDFKRGGNRRPSKLFNRISLGEKGVGRLAVHKLATNIKLETKIPENIFGYSFEIDWKNLINNSTYIQDAKVNVDVCNNNIFLGTPHGTRIILSNLRKKDWIRKDFRNLARTVNTIMSPFQTNDNFQVKLILPEQQQKWVTDIFEVKDILANSIYYFKFKIDLSGNYSWRYKFNPPSGFNLKQNENSKDKDTLLLDNKQSLILKKENLDGIGEISGEIYIYNLLPDVLGTFNQKATIKDYMKENAGIRVYRDGIRVYNYGEPGNDWLELDIARLNKPGENISNNTILGSFNLKLIQSIGLKEKTNREGFDQNEYFERFKEIGQSIFKHIASVSQKDRENLDYAIKKDKPIKKVGFSESIKELKDQLQKRNLETEFGKSVLKVEKDYNQMRDVMLNSGIAGLNLSLVFHEVEREVRTLNEDVKRGASLNLMSEKIRNLAILLDGFSPLLKQNKRKIEDISKIVSRVVNLSGSRMKYHKILFSSPLLSNESPDFKIFGATNLLVSAINNILDNSIYWTRVKSQKGYDHYIPRILITTDIKNFNGNPTLIIADNGEGFRLPVDDLTTPFVSTRPGGMGLGLYYTSLVMEMSEGKLLFLDPKDYDLPKGIDGATIGLQFKKTE